MQYRREIDGLRALAVLPVLLFHAGFSAFSGGFVGVDVFFVISGYLITSIILAEKAQGRFTIAGFYERRARRILPALFVVLIACVPFAWAWMFPADLEGFANSLAAVCVFASNIVFSREAGYFDTAAELKPLLHTWSLAVEEQYYVVFPLIVVLLWRFVRRWMWVAFGLLALLTLTAAELRVASHPAPTFYLLPTRGWELLIGAMLALHAFERPAPADVSPPSGWLHAWAPALGLLLIAVPVFVYDKTTPFPGLTALLPTLGAALLIHFGDARVGVGRLLAHPAMVGIGLLSYSVYLWHQPLFAFARIRSAEAPGVATFAVLIALAFLLAWLTWRFVERPFRDRRRFTRRQIFVYSLVATVVVFAAGVTGKLGHGFPERFPPEVARVFAPERSRLAGGCTPRALAGQPSVLLCEFGQPDARRTVALYGDSHSEALLKTLDASFRQQGLRGVKVSVRSCEPLPKVISVNAGHRDDRQQKAARCMAAYPALLDYLRANVDHIVVHMRWTQRVFPVPGEVESLAYDNGEGGVEFPEAKHYSTLQGDGAAAKQAAIEHLVESLRALGKPMTLVYPVPEVGWDVPRHNYRAYITGGAIPPRISTSHERIKARNAFVERVLDGVPGDDKLARVRPERLLCSTVEAGRCMAQLDGVPLYADDDHLSDAGARLVSDEIMKTIGR